MVGVDAILRWVIVRLLVLVEATGVDTADDEEATKGVDLFVAAEAEKSKKGVFEKRREAGKANAVVCNARAGDEKLLTVWNRADTTTMPGLLMSMIQRC